MAKPEILGYLKSTTNTKERYTTWHEVRDSDNNRKELLEADDVIWASSLSECVARLKEQYPDLAPSYGQVYADETHAYVYDIPCVQMSQGVIELVAAARQFGSVCVADQLAYQTLQRVDELEEHDCVIIKDKDTNSTYVSYDPKTVKRRRLSRATRALKPPPRLVHVREPVTAALQCAAQLHGERDPICWQLSQWNGAMYAECDCVKSVQACRFRCIVLTLEAIHGKQKVARLAPLRQLIATWQRYPELHAKKFQGQPKLIAWFEGQPKVKQRGVYMAWSPGTGKMNGRA